MLNAISTLKRHGKPDPVTQKTVSLLERGLSQIRDTVAALLVETKVKSRPLTPRPGRRPHPGDPGGAQARHATRLVWSSCRTPLALPSTLVRQLLINLLLNAIAAAGPAGMWL